MLTFYKNKIKNIDVLVQVEDAVVIFFFYWNHLTCRTFLSNKYRQGLNCYDIERLWTNLTQLKSYGQN